MQPYYDGQPKNYVDWLTRLESTLALVTDLTNEGKAYVASYSLTPDLRNNIGQCNTHQAVIEAVRLYAFRGMTPLQIRSAWMNLRLTSCPDYLTLDTFIDQFEQQRRLLLGEQPPTLEVYHLFLAALPSFLAMPLQKDLKPPAEGETSSHLVMRCRTAATSALQMALLERPSRAHAKAVETVETPEYVPVMASALATQPHKRDRSRKPAPFRGTPTARHGSSAPATDRPARVCKRCGEPGHNSVTCTAAQPVPGPWNNNLQPF